MRDINQEITVLINQHDVVLFMKGTPDAPQCGFSNLVCQALAKFDTPFTSINILEDDVMRQGIKDFTQWPTIPQLYIKGEFIGGADIVKQLYQSGELEKLLLPITTVTTA